MVKFLNFVVAASASSAAVEGFSAGGGQTQNHRSWASASSSRLCAETDAAVDLIAKDMLRRKGGDMDESSAFASFAASQAKVVEKITGSIDDLTLETDEVSTSESGFTVDGKTVRLQGGEAPGGSNVAWLSDLSVEDKLSSLTIYNGPLTDVPHLVSRAAIKDGRVNLFLDIRPRAYGAYDLRDKEGNYPGPEELGRKAFEYSGARKDFDSKFGTGDLVAFLDEMTGKFDGATELPGLDDDGLDEAERVTRGPLALAYDMPLSDANVNTINAIREKAASSWLEWSRDDSHGHRPGAPINTQFVYDTKFRINSYGALLGAYVGLFGQSEGERLAASDSGPIDEAYVGGGS